jgi:hypothetical protein
VIVDKCCLTVSSGLFEALHALRYEDKERLVWADGICIDQSNLSERSFQVAMMAEIYETAANVVVYLGQPTEHTEGGMRALQYFVSANARSPPWSHMTSVEVQKSLADLLDRPWFTRMWTVQEAILARKLTLCLGIIACGGPRM